MTPRSGGRVWIVGPAGAGKTTLATTIRSRLPVNSHDLDSLYWLPGWRRRPDEQFRAVVAGIARADSWVVDGQYEVVSDLLSERADLVVWLDPPWPVTLARVLRRSITRLLRREFICNGNQESLRSAAGMLLWALRSRTAVRRANRDLFSRLPAHRTRRIRSSSRTQVDALITAIGDT